MRLGKDFFIQPATIVAPMLIGKFLCRQLDGNIMRYMITETECYFGSDDTACHAKRGVTPSNKSLFLEGGVAYVYLCYGIHYLFNTVTGAEGHGEGVLIRGVEGAVGPGRVTKLLEIDKTLNGHDLIHSNEIWLEDGGEAPHYVTLKRVGIDYAEEADRDRLWRYKII